MSQKSWIKTLGQILQTSNRVAIVGVGNELRGDDAVGLQIVRALRENMLPMERVLLCEAGPAPENFTSALRRFMPDSILLIDAVHMDALPGTIRLLNVHEITHHAASTHTLSLTLFAQYIQTELNCTVTLLGIQPMDLSFGRSLSPALRASVNMVTRTIQSVF